MMPSSLTLASKDDRAIEVRRCERAQQLGDVGDEAVAQPVHQLGLEALLRQHDDGALALACGIPGFKMRTLAARQEQHTGVAPMQGVAIELEAVVSFRTAYAVDIRVNRPVFPF